MGAAELLQMLGDAVEDPEEESFLLFSSPIPSSNLGFVDSKARDLELTINGRDVVIQQSPGLLNSDLPGGTTGAVLWKVTPAFASWISSPDNVLFGTDTLSSNSVALELGTGVSGLVALALRYHVQKYVATDQSYVLKTLRGNIEANIQSKATKSKQQVSNIEILALDWEESNIDELPSLLPEIIKEEPEHAGFDVIVACDCIYNEALVPSFVETCVRLCSLRTSRSSPTLCLVAQQLRSNVVFEEWLQAFHKKFQVWRVPDELLNKELQEGNGFVVHVGSLR